MKILITGGAGFIGSHLSDALLARGDEVFIIDDLSTGSLSNIKHLEDRDRFHCSVDSILNRERMEDLISQCDFIFHLAAAVGVKYIIDNPLRSLEINIKGTEVVLELANEYKKRVLIASSSEIYGKHNHSPLKEDDNRILGPVTINRWSYSCSKAIDEFYALAYFREKKLPIIVVRFFNTVGPRQTGRYGMVIPRFIKQALLGQPITVYGDGRQTRTFTYISDVIDGLLCLLQEEKANGQIFNIGGIEEISIIDLAQKIKLMTRSKSEIVKIPYAQAYESGFEDMYRRVPDITKISKMTGFKPKISLNAMLKRIIDYFEE